MKTYVPEPIDTSHVVLPADVLELREKLAENNHEVWAAQRIAQGWTFGPKRNDALAVSLPAIIQGDDGGVALADHGDVRDDIDHAIISPRGVAPRRGAGGQNNGVAGLRIDVIGVFKITLGAGGAGNGLGTHHQPTHLSDQHQQDGAFHGLMGVVEKFGPAFSLLKEGKTG